MAPETNRATKGKVGGSPDNSGDSKCPSRWCTGRVGLSMASASASAKAQPTSSAPTNPDRAYRPQHRPAPASGRRCSRPRAAAARPAGCDRERPARGPRRRTRHASPPVNRGRATANRRRCRTARYRFHRRKIQCRELTSARILPRMLVSGSGARSNQRIKLEQNAFCHILVGYPQRCGNKICAPCRLLDLTGA